MKVLIVGAGPTGLTAAIVLAKHGIMPAIVDRRENASTLSRAVGITPASLKILSHFGVAQRLIEEGVAMNGLRVYRGEKLALSMPLHSDWTYFPNILGLPQDRTEDIMAEVFQAAGGKVQYDRALTNLEDKNDIVEVRFSDGTQDTFDTVIGADGVQSTVREQAGLNYPGNDLKQVWSIADIDAEDWRHPTKITMIISGREQVVVVAPMGGIALPGRRQR